MQDALPCAARPAGPPPDAPGTLATGAAPALLRTLSQAQAAQPSAAAAHMGDGAQGGRSGGRSVPRVHSCGGIAPSSNRPLLSRQSTGSVGTQVYEAAHQAHTRAARWLLAHTCSEHTLARARAHAGGRSSGHLQGVGACPVSPSRSPAAASLARMSGGDLEAGSFFQSQQGMPRKGSFSSQDQQVSTPRSFSPGRLGVEGYASSGALDVLHAPASALNSLGQVRPHRCRMVPRRLGRPSLTHASCRVWPARSLRSTTWGNPPARRPSRGSLWRGQATAPKVRRRPEEGLYIRASRHPRAGGAIGLGARRQSEVVCCCPGAAFFCRTLCPFFKLALSL